MRLINPEVHYLPQGEGREGIYKQIELDYILIISKLWLKENQKNTLL